jgi:hypothetical protein
MGRSQTKKMARNQPLLGSDHGEEGATLFRTDHCPDFVLRRQPETVLNDPPGEKITNQCQQGFLFEFLIVTLPYQSVVNGVVLVNNHLEEMK